MSGGPKEITFTAFHIPISAVLQWPLANFLNPQKRHWYVVYGAVLEGFATAVVIARLWTRIGKRAGAFGADDILIVLSWAAAAATYGLSCWGIHNGLDRHVWDILPKYAEKAGFAAWITEMCFLTSLCLTKTSVLLFFRRLIDRTHNRILALSITGLILFTIAYWIAFFVFLIAACSPVEATWKSLNVGYGVPYKCAERNVVDPLNGALSTLSDIYSMVIPVIIVRKLNIPLSRKIVLYFVFTCGLIVVGAGVARTYYISRMYTDARRDVTWLGYDTIVWATLEMQLAIVCASAPAMKGFFSKIGDAVASRYGSRGTNSYNHSRSKFNRQIGGKSSLLDGSDSYNLTSVTPNSDFSSGNYNLRSDWSEKADEKPSTRWPGSEVKPVLPSPPPSYLTSRSSNSTRRTERMPRHTPLPVAGGNDYIQLHGSGIHVEQRWSVTSWDAERDGPNREVSNHDAINRTRAQVRRI